METKEFTSSQEESTFTQMLEKLGFSITALAKGGNWGISLKAGMDQSMHSESRKIQQSHSTHSYFCSTKFSYIPLASFYFPIDQLQLSNAALQELKYVEDLLSQSEDPDKLRLLRHKAEAFFQRIGSHANQGPLHLGGIYWWKAISEGFQQERLAEVKQQASEMLDICIRQIRRSWQQVGKSVNEKDNYKNQQMSCVSAPTVSFIRVGTGFSASRSQIMNCLLSERKHDAFFHRHCKGSSRDCLLMGGVVEVTWFCPGGEEQDRFDNCLTFTNLHGDAKEHENQLAFLQEVSSIIVVLMSTSDDNKGNRKIVHDMCQSSKPLIFLLDDIRKVTVNKSSSRVKIGIRNRNEAELIGELTTTIKRLLKLSNTALSLENCAQVARKQGMLIDEDQRDCKKAKE
ncbi:hypothetical protein ABFV05_011554 [Capra hircus]